MNFKQMIGRAESACFTSARRSENPFVDVTEMVPCSTQFGPRTRNVKCVGATPSPPQPVLQRTQDFETFIRIGQMATTATALVGWIGKTPGEILSELVTPDPAGTMADSYLEFLVQAMRAITGFANKEVTGWRAFIEIQAWGPKMDGETGGWAKDAEGHVIVEKINDPYWVEVIGLRGYMWRVGYVDERSKPKPEYAILAARRGIQFWKCSKRGHSVPAAWLDPLTESIDPVSIIYYGNYKYTGPTLLSAFAGVDPVVE